MGEGWGEAATIICGYLDRPRIGQLELCLPQATPLVPAGLPRAELRLVIELDGGQHYDSRGLEMDRLRTAYLQRDGLEVLRVSNLDVLQNLDGIPTKLLRWIEARPLTPTLSRREKEQD